MLQFIDRFLPDQSTEHFQLVVGSDLRTAMERSLADSVVPIAYGERREDLADFIESLAAGKPQLEVSQDPAFYERRSRGARRGFLDVAAPAEAALSRVRDAIEDTLRGIGAVERRSATLRGIENWTLVQQQEHHEQLAAAVSWPASRLVRSASLLEQFIQDADDRLKLLLEGRFASQRDRLKPVLNEVEALDGLARDPPQPCRRSLRRTRSSAAGQRGL